MDWGICAASIARPCGLRPEQSRAQVAFLLGERSAAEQIARRLFRRPLRAWQYAALAGAPDDAQVEVGASGGDLYIELGDPLAAAYRGHFYVRRMAARLVLLNDGFHIRLRRSQGRGLGLRVFRRQVAGAAALGIDSIQATASRRGDENGYYTWPRFGFDGAMPARLRRDLPSGLRWARTVLDLMEREEGRLWWRAHGATIRVTFDLRAGSRSRAALQRYALAKISRAW
jgi:hypothetical protein